MSMRAGPVFLGENLRPKRALCCSFKVGTTTIAILEIIINLILIFMGQIHVGSVTKDSAAFKVIHVDMEVIRIAGNIHRTIKIVVTAAMISGNITDNKKLMMPYIFLKLVDLIALIQLETVLTLAYICLLKFTDAIMKIILGTIRIVVGMFFWQIVQCRVIELDEMARPNEVCDHGDPENPAYGNLEGTLVQTTGAPPTASFVNEPIKSMPTGTAIPY